jgi:hypothetical protein
MLAIDVYQTVFRHPLSSVVNLAQFLLDSNSSRSSRRCVKLSQINCNTHFENEFETRSLLKTRMRSHG